MPESYPRYNEEDIRQLAYSRRDTRESKIDPFEEAKLFQRFKDSGWTQERIAKTYFGSARSGPLVALKLSLLRLPEETKSKIQSLHLDWTTARLLVPLEPNQQKLVISQVENYIQQTGRKPGRRWVQGRVKEAVSAKGGRATPPAKSRSSQVEVATLTLLLKLMGQDIRPKSLSELGLGRATVFTALKRLEEKHVLRKSGRSYILSEETQLLLKSLKEKTGIGGIARFLTNILELTEQEVEDLIHDIRVLSGGRT